MTVTEARQRLELLQDPSSEYFKAIEKIMIRSYRSKNEEASRSKAEVTLPCADTGEMMVAYQEAFRVGVKRVKGLKMASSTFSNLEFLADGLQMRAKAFGDEEILAYDYPLPAVAASGGGFSHVCRTYRSAATLAGYREEEESLRKMVESPRNPSAGRNAAAILAELSAGQGPHVCSQAQTCDRSVDTILMSMTRGFMGPEQALRAMQAHGAVRAKMWFFFDVEMLVADEGTFSRWGLHWIVDRKRNKLHILNGKRDNVLLSVTYTHVVEWAMKNVVDSSALKSASRGLMERYDHVPHIWFCEMVDVEKSGYMDTVVETRLPMPFSVPHYLVEQRLHLPKASGGKVEKAVPMAALVEKELMDKIQQRAARLLDDKCTVTNILQAVGDYSSQRVVKGTFVRAPEGVSVEILPQFLAVAVYKREMLERARAEASRRFRTLQYKIVDAGATTAIALSLMLAMKKTQCKLESAWAHVDSVVSKYGFPDPEDSRVVVKLADQEWVREEVLGPVKASARFSDVLSYFPGGADRARFRKSRGSSMTTGVDDALDAAELLAAVQACDDVFYECEEGIVEVEEIQEVKNPLRTHVMSREREELVDKLVHDFDAHDLGDDKRGVDKPIVVQPCREITPVPDDPCDPTVLSEAHAMRLPGVGLFDYEFRSHLRSGDDQHLSFDAKYLKVNMAKSGAALPQEIRRSQVDASTSGRRPQTQFEAMNSVAGRIASAPDVAHDVVLEKEIEADVTRFADVCFRENWREIVADKVSRGVWQSSAAQLRNYVTKVDTAKVNRMNVERFVRGEIDLQAWLFMVKATPKAKVSPGVVATQTPTQTITYAEKKTENAIFSAITSAFHDMLDEILEPSVRINARRDMKGDEEWFNAHVREGATRGTPVTNVEVDISQCDKSQGVRTLLTWLRFMMMCGAPPEITELWYVLLTRKQASSAAVAIVIAFPGQVTSGFWGTISANSIIVGVSSVRALNIKRGEFILFGVRGDDVILVTRNPPDMLLAQREYTDGYNMESKVFFPKHLYWCSRYWIRLDGWWYWMYDPEKATESLGRALPARADVEEQQIAFRDKMQYYDDWDLCKLVAVAAAERQGRQVLDFAEVRVLSNLAHGENALTKFKGIYKEETEIIGV